MISKRSKTSRFGKPRKKAGAFMLRKRSCRFCRDKIKYVDYKDIKRLEMLIRERGNIIPTRNTGNCAKHQRRVAEAIERARFLALLPYSHY